MAKKKSPKKDQYTVVLEGLRSNFRVFGEGLSAVREDTGETKKEIRTIKEDLSYVKEGVGVIKGDLGYVKEEVGAVKEEIGVINERLVKLESDMEFVKTELSMIRHNLITRDEFKFLETRVLRLEKKLK